MASPDMFDAADEVLSPSPTQSNLFSLPRPSNVYVDVEAVRRRRRQQRLQTLRDNISTQLRVISAAVQMIVRSLTELFTFASNN